MHYAKTYGLFSLWFALLLKSPDQCRKTAHFWATKIAPWSLQEYSYPFLEQFFVINSKPHAHSLVFIRILSTTCEKDCASQPSREEMELQTVRLGSQRATSQKPSHLSGSRVLGPRSPAEPPPEHLHVPKHGGSPSTHHSGYTRLELQKYLQEDSKTVLLNPTNKDKNKGVGIKECHMSMLFAHEIVLEKYFAELK